MSTLCNYIDACGTGSYLFGQNVRCPEPCVVTGGGGTGSTDRVFVVNTLVDAAAVTTSPFNKILVYNGFLVGGDNGGSFVAAWDNDSLEVPNGFSVIQPNDQGGDATWKGRFIQTPSP